MDLDAEGLREILREVHKIRFNNKSVDIYDTFFNKIRDYENVDYMAKTLLYIKLCGSHYRISREKTQNKSDAIKFERYSFSSNNCRDTMYSLRFCSILPELDRIYKEDKEEIKKDNRKYL